MKRSELEAGWFLAQVKPNCQQIALRNLTRQGFVTFVPMFEQTRRARGRFVARKSPLFPGYLFVSLDPEMGGWRAVNSTQGITRLVSNGARPQPVPGAIMDELRQRCDDQGNLLEHGMEVHPGDQVVVSTGPFAVFAATVEKMAPEQRVWVLLDLMGRETRVAVDRRQLCPD